MACGFKSSSPHHLLNSPQFEFLTGIRNHLLPLLSLQDVLNYVPTSASYCKAFQLIAKAQICPPPFLSSTVRVCRFFALKQIFWRSPNCVRTVQFQGVNPGWDGGISLARLFSPQEYHHHEKNRYRDQAAYSRRSCRHT